MLNLVFNAIAFSVVAVGVVELLKGFIPDTVGSKAKAIIALVVELVVAILGAFAFSGDATVIAKIATVVATVGIAQVGYETVVKLITKLTAFLKSKITTKAE